MSTSFKDTAIDLFAGTMGGVAQVVVGHPLDTIKVRMQTQVHVAGQPPKYSGMVDCISKLVKGEGAAALYKGWAAPMFGACIMNSFLFFTYGQVTGIVRQVTDTPTGPLSLGALAVTSFVSGTLTGIVEGPVELIKVQLQNQVGYGGKNYKGVWDATSSIYKNYGMRGIMHGTGATMIRDGPCFGVQFLVFETVRKRLATKGEHPTFGQNFIAGATGGIGFWGLIYPVEIIKTRIQADHLDPAKRKYKGWVDCFKKSLKQEGVKGLFRGYTPTIARAIPANGAIFASVASTKTFLGRSDADFDEDE